MYINPRKKNDKDFHDNPPIFKSVDRKRYFYVEEHFKKLISTHVRGNSNLVFIVVAYGYFKATGQFFSIANQEDINYVAGKFKLTDIYSWKEYTSSTRERHRELILDALGYQCFSKESIQPLLQIIRNDARAQKPPHKCFVTVCEWLFEHKIETPNYSTIIETIDLVYKSHLEQQIAIVRRKLSSKNSAILDGLFEKSNGKFDSMEVHRLTLLKKIEQSTKVNKIRINIETYNTLRPLYEIASPVLQDLDFSQDGLKRYAISVERRQVFQIKRLKDSDRHLHLIIFIAFKFRELIDHLVETFLSSVKTAINAAESKAKEEYYRLRKEQSGHTQQLVSDTGNLVTVIDKLREILTNPTISAEEKIEASLNLISPKRLPISSVSENLNTVQEDLTRISGQALLMRFLEEGSKSIQLKCNDIVCKLNFDPDTHDSFLLSAIKKFQEKQGKVDGKFPIGFMENSEKRYVDDISGFRAALYKVLLFKHIAESIKSGTLNIIDSNKFKQLDQYLISKEFYQKNRKNLLRLADMGSFSNADETLKNLELQIDAQFQETNEHILENTNEYTQPDGLGGFKLVSERNTKAEALLDSKLELELFPKNEYIRIAEAINTVNKATDFLAEFEHNSFHHLKKRPEDKNFIAGIIALGGHLGVSKLSKNSFDLELATLESTTNGFFELTNLRNANDVIIRYVNQLPLSKVFETEFGMQTSSDGQKWPIAYESLNANKSFKYGGRDPVVAAYTFIDVRGMFTYSMVISGAEREAHYMIDGVLKHDVIKSSMHSTDTHGYTEAVFGLTHLLKITYAPRIKNPGKRHLYSFKVPSHYKKKGYPIYPKARIDVLLVKKYWEEILRLSVSIKLGEVSASQIFKRLNSYSSRKNPLYDALKVFGGIPKSLFILKYADDPNLRKAVHKQLNKGESGNRLDKALAIGRMEYTQTLKRDQEIAETCKRLMKNVVVCWNFLYLSKKLSLCKTEVERNLLLMKIKTSSMLVWEHFALHGEFNFSAPMLKDSQKFDFESLLDPDLIK